MESKKGKGAPPKLHKFMHPRNPYRTPPSFKNLAQKYPEFRTHCIYELDGKVRLNFKDPKAIRALTTCLLDQDYGLKVSIPDGRLVPTLPLRFNYLLWIEDLLTLSSYHCKQDRVVGKQDRVVGKQDRVVGVDIGCGSSCIYSLLATKKFNWCMVTTESDDVNYSSATNNVKNNDLQDQIILKKVKEQVILKTILDDEEITSNVSRLTQSTETGSQLSDNQKTGPQSQLSDNQKTDISVDQKRKEDRYIFDFTMCNPPFFGSEEETDSQSKSKKNRGEPTSAPTGALPETVTEGGEVAFITQMINESVLLQDRVRIFTTMIGSKAHVRELRDKLKSVNPQHTAVVEFCQGRTMRWGIAWTFNSNYHLENVMSKKQMADAKPLILMLPRSLMTVYTVPAAWAKINKWLHQLKINVQMFKSTKYFVGAHMKAYKTTWMHQRRKKRDRQRKEAMLSKSNDEKVAETPEDIIMEENELSLKEENEFSLKRTCSETQDEMHDDVNPEGSIKRQKITHDSSYDELDTQETLSDTNVKPSPEKLKEMSSLEELDTELPKSFEAANVEPKDSSKAGQDSSQHEGLECILKAKLQLKQTGRLISLEALYLRGSLGKDGLNQLLQYMRNQLTNPST